MFFYGVNKESIGRAMGQWQRIQRIEINLKFTAHKYLLKKPPELNREYHNP